MKKLNIHTNDSLQHKGFPSGHPSRTTLKETTSRDYIERAGSFLYNASIETFNKVLCLLCGFNSRCLNTPTFKYNNNDIV